MKEYLNHLTIFNPNHYKWNTIIDDNLGKDWNSKSGSINLPGDFGKGSMVPPQFRMEVLYLLSNEDHFFMIARAAISDKQMHFWVYFLGLQDEANEFSFKMRLYNPGSKNDIHLTGPTISTINNRMYMSESALQFGMPFDDIISYWEINTLSVSLEVTVVKERVPHLTVSKHEY